MTIPVLLAVTDPAWEADLVAGLGDAAGVVHVARRCVDLADLLSAAASGLGRVAVISADLRRLDRDALARLAVAGVAVVGVAAESDEDGNRRLLQWGITHLVSIGAEVADVASEAIAALGDSAADSRRAYSEPRIPTADTDPIYGYAEAPSLVAVNNPATVIAVWGPAGAPGRSTVALNLVADFAASGRSALLIDADVYAASAAQLLGLLDESPGLAAACRLANSGRLDLPALVAVTTPVSRNFSVLTGIARADRWPELRSGGIETVVDLSRRGFEVVVIDVGFCLEQDEELSYDTAAPRRNGATLAALDAADRIVAVGAADPVGLQRLVRGLAELREVTPDVAVDVVINRLRKGPVPGDAKAEITAALERYARVTPIAFLPDDQAALDRAVAAGRSLIEVGKDCDLAKSLHRLGEALAPRPEVATVRRRQRSAPRRRRQKQPAG